MSDIKGEGYGSKHNWEETATADHPKRTCYACRDCKIFFSHIHSRFASVFDEIKNDGIPEECNKGVNDEK